MVERPDFGQIFRSVRAAQKPQKWVSAPQMLSLLNGEISEWRLKKFAEEGIFTARKIGNRWEFDSETILREWALFKN